MHIVPAGHTFPQAPHADALLSTSVSHPFAALPSQSRNPKLHATEHAPEEQLALACGLGGQTVPHPPQFVGDERSASQPLLATPSQSA
jgi:hypothetical protein